MSGGAGSEEAPLGEPARHALVRLLRLLFPHAGLPDAPYERAAETLVRDASAAYGGLLLQGLIELEGDGDGLAGHDDEAASRALERLSGTPFFEETRRRAIAAFYSDPEVWELIGYEGPAFAQGGYLHRGFDELDWLPDPPI